MFTGLEIKFVVLPLAALSLLGWELATAVPEQVNVILNVAALVTIASGLLVYGRMKARGDAAAGAAEAWREERDAALARSERLREDLEDQRKMSEQLKIRIAELESRPTLEQVEQHLERLHALMMKTAESVQAAVGDKQQPG